MQITLLGKCQWLADDGRSVGSQSGSAFGRRSSDRGRGLRSGPRRHGDGTRAEIASGKRERDGRAGKGNDVREIVRKGKRRCKTGAALDVTNAKRSGRYRRTDVDGKRARAL